jgi:hypothetical protein
MLSTLRRLIAKVLSAEVGVLGDDVRQLRADLNELALAHGSLFESFKRYQSKTAMRYARGGSSGDGDLAAMLREALASKKGNNADFPEF